MNKIFHIYHCERSSRCCQFSLDSFDGCCCYNSRRHFFEFSRDFSHKFIYLIFLETKLRLIFSYVTLQSEFYKHSDEWHDFDSSSNDTHYVAKNTFVVPLSHWLRYSKSVVLTIRRVWRTTAAFNTQSTWFILRCRERKHLFSWA